MASHPAPARLGRPAPLPEPPEGWDDFATGDFDSGQDGDL